MLEFLFLKIRLMVDKSKNLAANALLFHTPEISIKHSKEENWELKTG